MFASAEFRIPEVWRVQVGGWALLYGLVLVPALPHRHEAGILAYNTWVIVLLFAASLAVRPVLHYASERWGSSWLQLEAFAFALCFAVGSVATYLTALLTFGPHGFHWSYWTLSGVQCALLLFLWATLYLSVLHWSHEPAQRASEPQLAVAPEPQLPVPTVRDEEDLPPARPEYPARFVARVGSRIQIVTPNEVLWVAAARDYAELHTRTSVHLLRETLTSLEGKLDPEKFLRIHRSRIVRVDQIVELVAIENSEYRVKLRDGSEHRSSRTYALPLANWLRSGADKSGADKAGAA